MRKDMLKAILIGRRTYLDTEKIVQEIDAEIARLTSARNILTAFGSKGRLGHARSGSPRAKLVRPARRSRLTPAGRKRISELMKKRWAERRKATAKAK